MTKGGARNRSGPAKDPNSLKSAQLGVVFTALPSEGYQGEVPDFPLPKRVVWYEYFEGSGRDRTKIRERDEGATDSTWERELAMWEWAWSTPQACAWAAQPWRLHTIAMWVRTYVICEGSEATAADKNSLHRFADQIGLTPAGLAENGWSIAENEIDAKRDEKDAGAPPPTSARDRMKVVAPDVDSA